MNDILAEPEKQEARVEEPAAKVEAPQTEVPVV